MRSILLYACLRGWYRWRDTSSKPHCRNVGLPLCSLFQRTADSGTRGKHCVGPVCTRQRREYWLAWDWLRRARHNVESCRPVRRFRAAVRSLGRAYLMAREARDATSPGRCLTEIREVIFKLLIAMGMLQNDGELE